MSVELGKIVAVLGVALMLGCKTTEHEPFARSVERILRHASLRPVVDQLAHPLLAEGRNIGMVVAVSTPQEDGIFAYGSTEPDGKLPMRTDAVFQVGSISKAFTALLAAQLAQEGRVDLDEPVDRLIPRDYALASPDLRRMTLAELASHTAGLPHEAYTGELLVGVITYLWNGKNLYRYLNTSMIKDYLAQLDFEAPGEKTYGYSNIGLTLMGWLLGQVDGKGYGRLLHEKIIDPLGLKHTSLSLVERKGRDLTPGHAGDLPTFVSRHTRVEPWLFDEGIAAAGGVQSTAADLLKLARVAAGIEPSSLTPAVRESLRPRAPAEGGQIAMCWFIKTLPVTNEPYTYIAGIIGGHTSFVGFHPPTKTAVVVLQNSINHDDRIAVPLLDRLVGAARSGWRSGPAPSTLSRNPSTQPVAR